MSVHIKKPPRVSEALNKSRSGWKPSTINLRNDARNGNGNSLTDSVAEKDGRVLAEICRQRLTPAHNIITSIYAGLFFHYLPSCVDDFKKSFYENIGGTNDQ